MLRMLVISASLFAVSVSAQAPAPTQAPVPAALALGTDIAARLLPAGTYQRMMGGTMSQMMGGLSEQMGTLPLVTFLKAAGLPEGDVAKLRGATLQQVMDIVDPAYRQRMRATMPVVMTETGKLMTRFEPAIRDGLAQAYATQFTPEQLRDIDAFLKTPSGTAFAARNMTIAADLAVMDKMKAFMPALMGAMPGIMEKAVAATANLPRPKTPAQLSDADRAKLAGLLGVSPAALNGTPR